MSMGVPAIVYVTLAAVGGSAVGVGGTVLELVAKEVSKEKYPALRTIGEVFSKVIQSTTAALALLVIGSLAANPIVSGASLLIASSMILTPLINGIVQHTGSEKLKRVMKTADQLASMTSKTINTAVLASAVFVVYGPLAAAVTGVSVGILSTVTYLKA